MSWIAVAVGAGTAIVGGVQSNQERQRKKGIIGKAYAIGEQRLKLRQGDVRQSVQESLGARGLTQGGAGARDLASQTVSDLAHEQDLERQDLASRKAGSYSDVNAEGDAGIVGSVVRGAQTTFGLADALHQGGGTPGTPGAARAGGAGVMVDTPPPGSASAYPGSFGGIDPVDPLGRGAWKSAATTGGFNVFNEGAT